MHYIENQNIIAILRNDYLRIFEGKKAGVEGGPDNYRERRPNK